MVAWYQNHWQALLLLQALCGTFVFAYTLKHRPLFWLRLSLSTLAGMAVMELLTANLFGRGLAGEIISISILYLMLIGIICLCNEVLVWTAMFVVSSGYMAQNIASCLKQLMRRLSWVEELVAATPAGPIPARGLRNSETRSRRCSPSWCC